MSREGDGMRVVFTAYAVFIVVGLAFSLWVGLAAR
jgi:hypothetical protein